MTIDPHSVAPEGSSAASPAGEEGLPAAAREDLDRVPSLVDGEIAHAVGRALYDPPQSETTLWRIPAMNVAFVVMSALLLVVTVWAIWQDHSRDWKRYSAEWRAIQSDQYRQNIRQEEQRLVAKERLPDLEKELRGHQARLNADGAFRDAEREALRSENRANMAELEAKYFKSKLDAERFRFEERRKAILDDLKDTEAGRMQLAAVEKDFDKNWVQAYELLRRQAGDLREQADATKQKVADMARERDELQKKIAALIRTRDQLRRNLLQVDRNVYNVIRNAPLIPPYAPSDQIQKVVVDDLTEPLNFLDVPRVDRCKTCHLNIDDPNPALADFTDPKSTHGGKLFRSHPRLDLFVGSASPHPYEQFGCTICHYGDGHATSFEYSAHTPRDHAQEKEWEEKYDWHKLHHQDFPMLSMQYISSTCAKCHTGQDRIDGAHLYNEGRRLVEDYGCFGCHKIQGFEKYRKVGPNLKHIRDKVDLSFMVRWIKDPPSFRPTTRMPKFFDQVNTTGTFHVVDRSGQLRPMNFTLRNEVEAQALASYLYGRSKPRNPEELFQAKGKTGDPARGKELVLKVGCLGCHSIQREGLFENEHAPDLSSIGSKVRPEWLIDWIVDPRKHDPQSRMPQLRLEKDEGGDQKLADIVAYLMTLRDAEFETRPVPDANAPERLDILREIAFDYLRQAQNATRAAAHARADGMSSDELLSYVGEKLVGRYGCFGCHAGISDEFDKAQPIGTELTQEGSKEVDKLDFARWGHQRTGEYAIPHSKSAWFTTKITEPRIFDTIPKEVRRADGSLGYDPTTEIVQKTPEELLKMPLFSFRKVHDPAGGAPEDAARRKALRDERVQGVVAFVLSRLDDRIPLQKKRTLTADEQAVEEGRNLIRFLNCQGCHRIGGDPQEKRLSELPTYAYGGSEDELRLNEVERETWLAEDLHLGKMAIPAGTFLFTEVKDENDPQSEEPFSVRQLAARYWESAKTLERDRRLKVFGLGEAKMRHYVGDSAEARPMAAPILRKEGDRVNGDWLFNFLLNVKPLRIQLDLRMPSFHLTPEEANVLVRWFKVSTGAPSPRLSLKPEQVKELRRWFGLPEDMRWPPLDLKPDQRKALSDWIKTRGRPPYPLETFPEYPLTPEARKLAEQGREMFQVTFPGDKLKDIRLQCNTCHPAGDKKPSVQDRTAWGPDLGLARERLRPPWIGRWVLDPKSHQPGTKMPDNFVSFDDPLQGMSVLRKGYEKEVEAIIQYLMHMRELDPGATAGR